MDGGLGRVDHFCAWVVVAGVYDFDLAGTWRAEHGIYYVIFKTLK